MTSGPRAGCLARTRKSGLRHGARSVSRLPRSRWSGAACPHRRAWRLSGRHPSKRWRRSPRTRHGRSGTALRGFTGTTRRKRTGSRTRCARCLISGRRWRYQAKRPLTWTRRSGFWRSRSLTPRSRITASGWPGIGSGRLPSPSWKVKGSGTKISLRRVSSRSRGFPPPGKVSLKHRERSIWERTLRTLARSQPPALKSSPT